MNDQNCFFVLHLNRYVNIPRASDNPCLSQARGCRTNADCLITQACQGGACVNPCIGQRCADHERCVVRAHAPVCACKHKLAINAVGELSCPGEGSSCSLLSAVCLLLK